MSGGADLRIISELGLGHTHGEEKKEQMIPFISEGNYLDGLNKATSGNQTLLSQGLRIQAEPRQVREMCEVQQVRQGRAVGPRHPDKRVLRRHSNSGLIKTKKAGLAVQAGLDSPPPGVSRIAPKFLPPGIRR